MKRAPAMSLWSGASGRAGAFSSAPKGAVHLAAVERVKDWTRSRFALAEGDVVLVIEEHSGLPGFPPVETVVAFWSAEALRHHFRVFKPAAQIAEDDLPPPWMKDALATPEGIECYCC